MKYAMNNNQLLFMRCSLGTLTLKTTLNTTITFYITWRNDLEINFKIVCQNIYTSFGALNTFLMHFIFCFHNFFACSEKKVVHVTDHKWYCISQANTKLGSSLVSKTFLYMLTMTVFKNWQTFYVKS